MSAIAAQFARELRRRLRQERACGLLLALGRVVVPTVAVGTALVLFDWGFALPVAARVVLGILAAGSLAGWCGQRLWRALRRQPADVARAADRATGDPRRSILSALELEQSGLAEGGQGLSGALAGRAAERGCERLLAAPSVWRCHGPRLRREGAWAALGLCLAVLALWWGQPAAGILLGRWLTPWRDLPPWSQFQFVVSPDPAAVPFGGQLALQVTVTGDAIRTPVELVTRARGEVQSSPCFRESEGRYAVRLENVVEPLEFCFRSGRARSRWHRLELLMQPEVLAAIVSIQPPVYSGLPARQFTLGEEPVRALRGSLLTLRLIGNRAVPAGSLKLTDANTGAVADVVGTADRDGAMGFQWKVMGDAFGLATVTSADGLTCRAPVEFRQIAVADAPPRATILEPGLFALATPTSRVPVQALAEDDLGLAKVTLIRAVAGYRDRALPLPVAAGVKLREVGFELALATLGVEPGETLELCLEAQDGNPELTGVGISDVARLEIISEEQYAELLRQRVAAEQLGERFRQAATALQEVLKTARALEDALKAGDAAQAAELHAQLREQSAQARELFDALSEEAVVFDVESELRDALRDRVGDLKVLEHWLEKMGPTDERLPGTLAEMVERLTPGSADLERQTERAEEVAAVAAVMRRAGEFQELVQRQRVLTRQLLRASNADRVLLSLAAEQDRIREALGGFERHLRASAAALPPDFAELQTSALAFADALVAAGIDAPMAAAAEAARQPDVLTARDRALAAQRALEALLSEPCKGGEGFAGLCQGKLSFRVPDPLAATCRQIAAGLGLGQASGMGASGGSGDPASGFSASGNGLGRDVPVFGKPRSSNASATGPASGAGDGKGGKGAGRAEATAPASREARGRERTTTESSQARPSHGVHPRYRDALRRYYSGDNP